MNEIIAKLKETGKSDAFNSQEEFTAAAKSLGYSDEDISAAVGSISFPLSDDELENVAGGQSYRRPKDNALYRIYVVCKKCGNTLYSGQTLNSYAADDEIKKIKANHPSCKCGGMCEPTAKTEKIDAFY